MISQSQLKKFIALLRQGELVSFPTETVYALAGDARQSVAIKKIFALKRRPLHQPLSVLLKNAGDVSGWAERPSAAARCLINYFWPGPLTVLLSKKADVIPLLVGGGNKIGLRVPDHPVAQAVLTAFGSGLAAPSANRSADLSPTQPSHVQQAFGSHFPGLIKGGVCTLGVESTIVDMTTPIPTIVRLGLIPQRALQQVLGEELLLEAPALMSKLTLRLQPVKRGDLTRVVIDYLSQHKSVAVLASQTPGLTDSRLRWFAMPEAASDYLRAFYRCLHSVKQCAFDVVLVEVLPCGQEWDKVATLLPPIIM